MLLSPLKDFQNNLCFVLKNLYSMAALPYPLPPATNRTGKKSSKISKTSNPDKKGSYLSAIKQKLKNKTTLNVMCKKDGYKHNQTM